MPRLTCNEVHVVNMIEDVIKRNEGRTRWRRDVSALVFEILYQREVAKIGQH